MDFLRAEEMEGRDLPHLAPVIAVGRESHVDAFVGELLLPEELGAAAEGEVLRFEDLLGELGRGDDDDGHGAELEADDGAVFVGEFGEVKGEVFGGEELVEVAYHGEAGRARWGPGFGGFGGFVEEV